MTCPWPPMSKRPARNASAIPRPERTSGVVETRVSERGWNARTKSAVFPVLNARAITLGLPMEPENSEPYALAMAFPVRTTASPGALKTFRHAWAASGVASTMMMAPTIKALTKASTVMTNVLPVSKSSYTRRRSGGRDNRSGPLTTMPPARRSSGRFPPSEARSAPA